MIIDVFHEPENAVAALNNIKMVLQKMITAILFLLLLLHLILEKQQHIV